MLFTPYLSSMANTPWVLYINPAAGSGKAIKSKPLIENALLEQRIPFETVLSEFEGDSAKLIHRELSKGNRHFIIAGGDGTLNEVVNAIMNQSIVKSEDVTITQIPLGTGNDWRRTWQLPSKLYHQIQLIKNGKSILQDLGKITFINKPDEEAVWFINVAGIGFDSQVTYAANKEKKLGESGTLIYLKHLVLTLFKFKAPEFSIKHNNESLNFKGFTVLAGICKFAGNKMMLVPHANPRDGLLSIVLVKNLNKLKVIRKLPLLFNGKFINLKEVTIFDCNKITIESDPAFYVQIDGESKGKSPIEIDVFQSKIAIIIP